MKTCTRCEAQPRRSPTQRWCNACHAENARKNRTPWSSMPPEARARHNCRAKTRIYVARGLLTQASECAHCGSAKNLERHHPDYSYFRNFTTLCRPCHLKLEQERQ